MTVISDENTLMIKSDNINSIEPDIIIIKNEYFIDVKYASFTLLKFLAPKFCEIIDIIAVFIPNIGNSTTCSILVPTPYPATAYSPEIPM